MKKRIFININLAIILIIIVGFLGITILNFKTYSPIIEDDIKNITKLTSTNIYSEINNELTKPIFVSLTMANDSFLKNWLANEQLASTDKKYLKKLQDYLIGIRSKYDYNSVFFISEKTKSYYHYGGILKTISPKNSHDKWYYDFVKSNIVYDLDVDQDEAKNNSLTVFVNCRVEDKNGALLGVVGVGVEITQLQALLESFEDNFHLEAFLIDPDGLVQIHTDVKKIEKSNIFKQKEMVPFKDRITKDRTSLVTCRFVQDNAHGYLITRYIKEMDWFLIVKKDTSILNQSFHKQIFHDFFIVLSILFLLLIISTYSITRYNKYILKLVKTDELTGLPNRRAFNEELHSAMQDFKNNQKSFQVFIFDIDYFKKINDTYGHSFGDTVITRIASMAETAVGTNGMVARWGGDEFSGIIYGNTEEAREIASHLVKNARVLPELEEYSITISLGITRVLDQDSVKTILNRSDSGLYQAKSEGRNRSAFV